MPASSPAAEPRTIFLVRHAERADAGATPQNYPGLSGKGHARAQALASDLRDAGLTAIYVTEYRRTQQTAAPLADSLGLKPGVVPAQATATLLAQPAPPAFS